MNQINLRFLVTDKTLTCATAPPLYQFCKMFFTLQCILYFIHWHISMAAASIMADQNLMPISVMPSSPPSHFDCAFNEKSNKLAAGSSWYIWTSTISLIAFIYVYMEFNPIVDKYGLLWTDHPRASSSSQIATSSSSSSCSSSSSSSQISGLSSTDNR